MGGVYMDTKDITVIYAVPDHLDNELYQIALDMWSKLNVKVHNIYREYFLIEKIYEIEEEQIWKKGKRIVLFFPLVTFSVPNLLKNYLEQIHEILKLETKNNPELLLVVSTKEHYVNFQVSGKYRCTMFDLVRFLQVWARSLNMKFLVPEFLFNINTASKENIDTLKTTVAKTLVPELPYILTIENEDKVYVNKVMTK